MVESTDNRKIFSLLEVTNSIQRTLAQRYTTSFWVKAEMNKLNHYPHSGHCYPDLVEKKDGKVIAQLKATLWRDDYNRVNRNFLSVVKAPLKDGITMLFCARITFDALHGLSLRIVDIDPVFSLGELEREKQESIARLQEEGIFNTNKALPLPLLPKRLAVISVQTSKGYADFNKIIDNNPWGYRFLHILFPSLLQGDRAVESIRFQLQRIRKVVSHFDVVAIIRGGGGEVGLSCFNDYSLAREIALFPIPVITGIGHATNETVVEMVAHKNAITPTELADFLLQKFHNFSEPVIRAERVLAERVRQIILDERQRIYHTAKYFRSVTVNLLFQSKQSVQHHERELFRQSSQSIMRLREYQNALMYKLRSASLSAINSHARELNQSASFLQKDVNAFMKERRSAMSNLEKTVSNLHPANVLKRGYSITRKNGKAVTQASDVKGGDELETIVSDGVIYSNITSVKS